jgi:hypothetical protein
MRSSSTRTAPASGSRRSTRCSPPYTALGWQVDDIERTITALRVRGVTFERFGFLVQDGFDVWTTDDGSKVAWFNDPDGNLLSLTRPA